MEQPTQETLEAACQEAVTSADGIGVSTGHAHGNKREGRRCWPWQRWWCGLRALAEGW